MKKAKALQDFYCYGIQIKKGDILQQSCSERYHYHCAGSSAGIYYTLIENNPHIFQCPYEEQLTSEQWDEKARGYGYWIPRDGKTYFFVRVSWGKVDSSYSWGGDFMDIALLRAGLAFETREEAEELLKKLKKEKQL